MNKFKLICTHNPQDFFNGEEPYELAKIYTINKLDKAVKKELANGYKVIVLRAEKEDEIY